MRAIRSGAILRYVHDLVEAGENEGVSDADVLCRFVAERDEGAFATLVQRHAAAVWAVCRHLLHHEQDAEDAFQATFLLLARRAGSIRKAEAVGSWLYGVAYRVAVRARQGARRRQSRERAAATGRNTSPPDAAWRDLQAALDEEVQRLPEKYRAPFVLCCLGCRARQEVARELGCCEGTISSRIARGRDLLQRRLARRGVGLPAALGAGVLGRQTAAVAVPTALVRATLAAVGSGGRASAGARALADGGFGTAAVGRWLLVVALLAGFGLLGATAVAPPPTDRPAVPTRPLTATGRTDLFGDPLPPGALARMGTVRFAHGDSMHGYPVLSPDRQTFATVGRHGFPHGGVVSLWDASTGKEVRCIHDPDFQPYAVFFLRGENLLGTLGISRTAVQGKADVHAMRFWGPLTGQKSPREMRVAGYPFEPWALSPDERYVASASREPPVLVRDRKTGKVLARWKGKGVRIDHLAFGAGGKSLLVCSGRSVHLWEWQAPREPRRLFELPNDPERLWFSPDGKWLAIAISSEGLRVWETARFTEVRRFKGQHDVRFFPDGKRFVSTDTGKVWDVASGKQVGRFEDCAHCLALEFSHDGKTATGYALGRIRRWDAVTGKDRSSPPLATNRTMIHQVAFTPDGRTVASASPDGAVRLWDTTTGQERRTLVRGTDWDSRRPTFLRLAADGTVVVARGKRLSFFKGEEAAGTIEVADFAPNGLASLGISADGKRMVLAGGTGPSRLVQLWDLPGRKRLSSFRPPQDARLETLGVSGRTIALAVGSRVCLLNAFTGQVEQAFPGSAPPRRGEGGGYAYFPGVGALAFSPDGSLVASAGHADGALVLLDVPSGKRRHVLRPAARPGASYELRNVVFSPDGAMLAAESRDGVVDVWETSSCRRRRRFLGHRSYQTALAFSPDGRRLATGNRDATILVWDVFGVWTGGPAAPRPPAAKRAALWDRLGDADAERACLAMGRLMCCPEARVPLLKRHLLGQKGPERARIKRWIADLDSDEFPKRQQASRQLAKHLASAEPALKATLADRPSLEVQQRIRRLFRQAEQEPPPAKTLQGLRALEVLEHAGSKDAEEALRELAEGDYEPRLAAAARAAWNRLSALRKSR